MLSPGVAVRAIGTVVRPRWAATGRLKLKAIAVSAQGGRGKGAQAAGGVKRGSENRRANVGGDRDSGDSLTVFVKVAQSNRVARSLIRGSVRGDGLDR